MLRGILNFHRSTLLYKCAGLTAEQLAQRAAAPSEVSLQGLIRHMTDVERIWFRNRCAGQGVGFVHKTAKRRDADFEDVDPRTAEADYAALIDEWKQCDAAVADFDLDHVFTHNDEKFSLRLVYLHMIGEYARHNGHADMVREHLDGVTGA